MEEIYVNVEHDKSVHSSPSTNQTGPRSSDSRCHGAVVLCLGLLSVFLLAGLIVLGVHHYNSAHGAAAELSSIKDKLTELLQDSKNKVSSLTEERDQLNARLNKTAEELNRLQKKTCPAGWHMFKFSCYFISHDSGSWKRGRQDCKDREADLVVIDSAEEQKLISHFTVEAWIGLTDSEEEGTWKWVDGSSLTLRQWEANQPDNGGGDIKWGEEDCAHILPGRELENNWNDLSCDASKHWICEKKLQQ
ncbi:CD209 antigen-like protein C [Channa argus]|uniref:CD209 antigen-like protein C n=1 Tax=Channa argus TaxID=215402 RepID=UPI0035206003